jgi:hypothetical protein
MKRRSRIVEHLVPLPVPVNGLSSFGPKVFGISAPLIVDVEIVGRHDPHVSVDRIYRIKSGFTRSNRRLKGFSN